MWKTRIRSDLFSLVYELAGSLKRLNGLCKRQLFTINCCNCLRHCGLTGTTCCTFRSVEEGQKKSCVLTFVTPFLTALLKTTTPQINKKPSDPWGKSSKENIILFLHTWQMFGQSTDFVILSQNLSISVVVSHLHSHFLLHFSSRLKKGQRGNSSNAMVSLHMCACVRACAHTLTQFKALLAAVFCHKGMKTF